MKKILGVLMLGLFLASSAACSGYRDVPTSHGTDQNVECVGFGKTQDPRYNYEIDTRNAIWAVIGCAGVGIFTVAWAVEYAYCPVSEALPVAPAESST